MNTKLDSVHNQDCIAGMKRLEGGVGRSGLRRSAVQHRLRVRRRTTTGWRARHYLDWCRQWTAEVVRVLKPNGTFWLAIGDEYAAELKVMLQREHGL